MNFYDTLGISYNASKSEIKKAYYKLVMKYHPDKIESPTEETYKKFYEIQTAYEILTDEEKKKDYDNMSYEERAELYDLIKEYFTTIKPQYSYIYKTIIDFAYSNKEEEFKDDINSFNVKNIFNKIITKINDEIIKRRKNKSIEIYGSEYDLVVSMKDKYINNFKTVKIMKEDGEDKEYLVPLYDSKFKIKDTDKGDIVINIILNNDTNYDIIDKYNLFYTKSVSLSQYIYGGEIKILLPDNDHLTFTFDCCLEKKPVFVLENKGLPINPADNSTNERGNLYVYITIEGVNNPQTDEVSLSYKTVVEDTIRIMFPPIKEP
ncbi:DnaJ domain protein [Klosneuvirus KNV1]|uniref:DnaJ domain protein n=1 Tax=Klosneuvirus KNV1 TaxID=1977640 RepID=A0A1V0SI04_9VIRU|nr:DnaJ domain protein [Klosneuvirus KNV1]